MKICIRENYIDTSVLERIDEKLLKKPPYNFQIVEVPDDRLDCVFDDFDVKRKKYVFSEEKYLARKNCDNALSKIDELKKFLNETDYKAIKFAEGVITSGDYEEIKQSRQRCREEINRLEKLINGGNDE